MGLGYQLLSFVLRPPHSLPCPCCAAGAGNTAGVARKFMVSARDRGGSLRLGSVTPSVLWYSEGKLMRVWRLVTK